MADGNNIPADPVANNQGYPDRDDILSRIANWDRVLDAHWSGWSVEAKTAFDYVAGRQWKRQEITDMEALSRIPVVFNRIAPTIDAVSGAEIGSRQQVQYFPRQVGDTAIDDVLTQGAEWIMDECEGVEEDSDAFRDALICGIGLTCTRPEYDQDSGVIKERIDPLEICWDPNSRKACFADARYLRRKRPMSKAEFKELFPGHEPEGDHGLDSKQPVIVDPRIRYDGTNGDETVSSDEVIVREYQWWDHEPRFLVADSDQIKAASLIKAMYPDVPTQDQFVVLTPEQHDEMLSHFPGAKTAQIKQKVFYRAFVAGSVFLQPVEPIEVEDFTYKAMTGKRDRNKNWWYGLVRPMIDPQRWANKFYSQILHIMRTNAQGGMIMEADAVDDIREFEATWADPSATTVVASGALSGPAGKKMEAKPTAAYPQGLDRLMEVAITAIRDTTGVNQEMLGLADRNQPGILESQRRQQAFGILAAFFDGKRRYHKMQGRLLLKTMSLYMPPDKLVRVTGSDNGPQYVPLALSKDAREYDVVVDEAPQGPNQKMQTFQILMQLMPLLQNAGLGADVWAEIARTSPLPAKVAEMIANDLIQKQQAAQQSAPQQQAMAQQEQQAKIADIAASAAHHGAQATLLNAKAKEVGVNTIKGAFGEPGSLQNEADQAKINLDRAKTSQILAHVVESMEKPQESPE